mgnify:CR=1 FL=1
MNDKGLKTKKPSVLHNRHQPLNKHPSASSIKHQGHCLPKEPPNITAYHHYALPRKPEYHKENKNRDIKIHINIPVITIINIININMNNKIYHILVQVILTTIHNTTNPTNKNNNSLPNNNPYQT